MHNMTYGRFGNRIERLENKPMFIRIPKIIPDDVAIQAAANALVSLNKKISLQLRKSLLDGRSMGRLTRLCAMRKRIVANIKELASRLQPTIEKSPLENADR